jgi:hypothetical protein
MGYKQHFQQGSQCTAGAIPTKKAACGGSSYVLLILIFIVSRVVYYLLGVRFDASGLTEYLQFINVDLLRHHLLQSLYYLHFQPPGYNLFLGIVLQMFPYTYGAVFHAINLIFGAAITCFLFCLMRSLGVRVRLALIMTVFFCLSPAVVLYENWILYDYQITFFLALGAVFLFRFIKYCNAMNAIGFLSCQLWLVMIRNQYHLIYFVVICVLLFYFAKRNRQLVACIGSVLVILVLALYMKNLLLFGRFASSTWMDMNLALLTTHQLTPEERNLFVSQGKLSPLSTAMEAACHTQPPVLGIPIAALRPYVAIPPQTSIPVLVHATS